MNDILFTNLIKERNVYRTLKLQGLDDNKLYFLTEVLIWLQMIMMRRYNQGLTDVVKLKEKRSMNSFPESVKGSSGIDL